MNKDKAIKTLSIIVIVGSIIVLFGWIFDIELFKRILPFWVTMKVSTALSFLISGIIVYYIAKMEKGDLNTASVVIPICILTLLILMGTLLISSALGVRTGLEDIGVKESRDAIQTVSPGKPSIGTMLSFIGISFAGIFSMFKISKMKKYLRIVGISVASLGTLAIVGYIIKVPALYYSIENVSTAMAFHTAILFILLGVNLYLVGKEIVEKVKNED